MSSKLNWIQDIFYSTEEVVKYIVHGIYCNLSYCISLRTDLEFRLHSSLKTHTYREREGERERGGERERLREKVGEMKPPLRSRHKLAT